MAETAAVRNTAPASLFEADRRVLKASQGQETVAICRRCSFVVAWQSVATMEAHLIQCHRQDDDEDDDVQVVEEKMSEPDHVMSADGRRKRSRCLHKSHIFVL